MRAYKLNSIVNGSLRILQLYKNKTEKLEGLKKEGLNEKC